MTGVVVRVLLNKGFCFVRGTDSIMRFSHRESFRPPEAFDTLREGQAVDFNPEQHEKGARATGVSVNIGQAASDERGNR